MASSLPNLPLVLSLSLLLLFPLCLAANTASLNYHGGPLLTGNLSLTLVWYGRFGRAQRNVIRSFTESLNYNAGANLQPQLSSWWKVMEGYQEVAGKRRCLINVKVAKQVIDTNYTMGKAINDNAVKLLLQKVSSEDSNTIPVIFTARDVSVEGLCKGKCSDHGVFGKQPYIMVGNPESECPGNCAWPFHKADKGPQSLILNAPNGNVGTDAMVIAFAQALAGAVTNPYKTGFFQENGRKSYIEAGSACQGIFGTGAFVGYVGKIRVDPSNGGGFNAHGIRGLKFLVPAIWNPKTKSCWTLL